MMKTALITGASSGIGAAFARQLAQEGYNLIIHGRRKEKLAELAGELRRLRAEARAETRAETAGGSESPSEKSPSGKSKSESERPNEEVVRIVCGDLMEQDTLNELAGVGREEKVDLLINNAGYGAMQDFFSDGDMQLNMLRVHCYVPALLCRELIPGMIERGGGQVINVSSVAGEQRLPQAIMYTSTKTFLTVFTESLAMRVRDDGVRVQALLPGFTRSDFHARMPEWKRERRNRGIVRWQTSEQVAAFSLRMIRTRRAGTIVISGFLNRFIVCVTTILLGNRMGKKLYRYLVRNM